MSEEMVPLPLSGEVWRGALTLRGHVQPTLCALTDEGTPWRWWGYGEWVRLCVVRHMAEVVAAAFAHERAVAAAERAARKAGVELWLCAIGGQASPARMEELRQALRATHDALRALGREP